MKKCKVCHQEKEQSHFLNGTKLTLRTCRDCRNKIQRENRKNNPEQFKKKDKELYQKSKDRRVSYARNYRKKYPERTRATNWKSKYGITSEEFYSKLLWQNNKCAICNRDMSDYGKIFCVDHNHKTGGIRGLLCDPCNYGLGFYEKHKDKYVNYLKLHNN